MSASKAISKPLAQPLLLGGLVAAGGFAIWYALFSKTRVVVGWNAGSPFLLNVQRLSIKLENGDAAWLRPDVAQAFESMLEAASADGVELRIASAYRSIEEQLVLWTRNKLTGIQTAPPGYSNHQQGTTLDLDVGVTTSHTSGVNSAWTWLMANAQQYGFCRTVSSEGWHFGYIGSSTNEPCLSCQSCVS